MHAAVVEESGAQRPLERSPALAAPQRELARAVLGAAMTPARAFALQRAIGNAAVSQLLQRRPKRPEPAADDVIAATPDLVALDKRHPNAVELLQMKLNWHLGFEGQSLLVEDGDYGPRTLRAVKAFQKAAKIKPADGNVEHETWEALAKDPATRSKGMTGPDGKPAVSPEYDKLAGDGLLEITLAEGFDENEPLFIEEVKEMVYGLMLVRGFKLGDREMLDVYEGLGRVPPSGGLPLFKKNVGTSDGKPVHCVVNLVTAVDVFTGRPYDHGRARGAEVKAAAIAGMKRSDLFIYDGHGRYGTGPDFDRNWWITVDWDRYAQLYKKPVKRDGKLRAGKEDIVDQTEVHHAEEDLGLQGRSPIKRFEKLEADGVVEFHGVGTGNIGINTEPNEMSLHGWLQSRATSSTEDELAKEFAGDKERDYRLWLFNGCNTFNYEKRIRGSGDAMSTRKLDMFLSQKSISGLTTSEALLSYLDGIIARESAAALEGRLEEAQVDGAAPYGQYGFEDNPGGSKKPAAPTRNCDSRACQL